MAPLKTWLLVVLLLGSFTGLALPRRTGEKPKPSPVLQKQGPSVVVYGEHIIHLSQDGKVHAWRSRGLGADAEYARALASPPLRLLATGGGRLWGTDLARAYLWSEDARAWKPEASLPATPEAALDLAVVGDRPVVVYTKHVVEARTGRVHPLSKLKNAAFEAMRALTVRATATHVWVGTGYGEWGGALFGLELASGRWVQFDDSLHYVTGIAEDGQGRLWVSWSMSHFDAKTLLRVHRPDATVERAFPELRSMYFQTVAWDDARQRLYGVEQQGVVRFEDGKPLELASLGKLSYSDEANAIGVAPGITRMEALGPQRFLLVHERAAPRVFVDGKVVALPME